jgi:hypothetical protein
MSHKDACPAVLRSFFSNVSLAARNVFAEFGSESAAQAKHHRPAQSPKRRNRCEVWASIPIDGTDDRHGVAKVEDARSNCLEEMDPRFGWHPSDASAFSDTTPG